MTHIQWNSLFSVNDYAMALNGIFVDVVSAINSGESEDLMDIKTKLDRFAKESPVSCAFLDLIARRTARDIFESEVRVALNSISERSIELKAVIAGLNAVTEEAKSNRKSIMLESLNEGLSKIEKSLQVIKTAEEALEQPNQDLLGRFETLKSAIEGLKELDE